MLDLGGPCHAFDSHRKAQWHAPSQPSGSFWNNGVALLYLRFSGHGGMAPVRVALMP